MKPISVLLVDDNLEFRESVRGFLSTEPHIQIVGQAASGREAVIQSDLLKPDLVLIDWTMPEMNGLEATQYIKGALNDIEGLTPYVIMLTLHDTPDHRAAAKAAKADGFLSKGELTIGLLPMITTLFQEVPAWREAPKPARDLAYSQMAWASSK